MGAPRNLSRHLFPSAHACCASRSARKAELYTSSRLTRPLSVHTLVDKDAFWSQLHFHLARLSRGTSLIRIDANATVGSTVCDSIGPVAPLQDSENDTFFESLLSSHRLAAVNRAHPRGRTLVITPSRLTFLRSRLFLSNL